MKPQSLYTDRNGLPELKISYCVFLDVLGFSKMIRDSFRTEDVNTLFQQFLRAINEGTHALNNTREMNYWQAKPFTDCVVLGCPVGKVEEGIELNRLVTAVAYYQLRMALSGFFVRGAIASDYLFMDGNTVYGPSIVEAHTLESTVAKVPRVMLSEQVQRAMYDLAKEYAEPSEAPQYRDLFVDMDGYAYINYLEQLVIENGDKKSVDGKKIREHKAQIESKLMAHSDSIDIWSKYYWLSSYHNYFCQLHMDLEGCENSEVLISSESTTRYPNRIDLRERDTQAPLENPAKTCIPIR